MGKTTSTRFVKKSSHLRTEIVKIVVDTRSNFIMPQLIMSYIISFCFLNIAHFPHSAKMLERDILQINQNIETDKNTSISYTLIFITVKGISRFSLFSPV